MEAHSYRGRVPWLLLDLALIVAALAGLAVLAHALWRRAAALGRELSRVSARIGQAAAGLEETLGPARRGP